METNQRDQDNDKWNGHQEKHAGGLNEGFSSENLPPGFNPGEKDARPLDRETEIDEDGNPRSVQRARHPDQPTAETEGGGAFASNRAIENPQSLQNRDYNYDRDADRYPPEHPENQKDTDYKP